MAGKKKTTKKSAVPARVGRPSKYDPKYCEMLVEHMAEGFSFEAFAGKLRVSRATVFNWRDQNPEFLDAYKVGLLAGRYRLEQIGLEALRKDPRDFNTGLWVFFMKARYQWTDKPEMKDVAEKIKTITIDMPSQKKQQIITIDQEKEDG